MLFCGSPCRRFVFTAFIVTWTKKNQWCNEWFSKYICIYTACISLVAAAPLLLRTLCTCLEVQHLFTIHLPVLPLLYLNISSWTVTCNSIHIKSRTDYSPPRCLSIQYSTCVLCDVLEQQGVFGEPQHLDGNNIFELQSATQSVTLRFLKGNRIK